MTPTTMRPDDDELVADLKRYFAATEVDEPPFRTRVVDSHAVSQRSSWRRLRLGGVVAATAAAVVVAAIAVPRTSLGGGGGASTSVAGAPTTVSGSAQRGTPPNVKLGPASAPGTTIAGPPASSSGGGAPAATPAKGSGATLIIGTGNGEIERSVAATYTVPQGSFLTAFDGLIARAVSMGGYVAGSTTSADDSGRIVTGSVTLKVPSSQLGTFINGMPSTFQASSVQFSSTDHTADYIDINAQLTSAKAQLAALNTLLARATALGDIVSIEQQIAQVQAQVDSYQGQINVINNQVDMATATIQLDERGATPTPSPSPNPVTNGLGGGWSNAVAVTGAILGGVVTVLPLAALAVILLAGWVLIRRRHS